MLHSSCFNVYFHSCLCFFVVCSSIDFKFKTLTPFSLPQKPNDGKDDEHNRIRRQVQSYSYTTTHPCALTNILTLKSTIENNHPLTARGYIGLAAFPLSLTSLTHSHSLYNYKPNGILSVFSRLWLFSVPSNTNTYIGNDRVYVVCVDTFIVGISFKLLSVSVARVTVVKSV